MVFTIIKLVSVVLLVLIFSNLWAQRDMKKEDKKKIEHKKNQ